MMSAKWSCRLIVPVLLAGYGFYLRFQSLAGRELWNDEIFQLHCTIGPFKPIWQRFSYGDMTCFPGDYLLTYPFVAMFQGNKWAMAAPHILVTLLGFYFLYKLCARYYKTVWGFVVAFAVVACNQHLVFHSFELRPYAVLPTLALTAVYYSDEFIGCFEELRQRKKVAIAALFIGIIWFHALGVLIVGMALLYFLLVKRGEAKNTKALVAIIKYIAIVFAIAMPVWFWFASGNPLGETKATFLAKGVHTFQFSTNPLDDFTRFFNYVFFYNLIGQKRLYFFLGCLMLMIFIPYREKQKKIGFWLVMIVLPILIILAASLFQGYWFLMRQYIFTVPLFAFFLGWLWDSSLHYYFDKTQRKWTIPSAIGFILMLVCVMMGTGGIILHAFN